MPVQYSLKPSFKIFFVEVWFNEVVHAFGLGFTEFVYGYAVAKDEDQAVSLTCDKHRQTGVKIRKVRATEARNQNLKRYCFPEDIAGIREGASQT